MKQTSQPVLGRRPGEVLAPGADGYAEAAATLFAAGTPELIVRPYDAAGVAAALRYAVDAGAPVSVRSGGHSVAGFGTHDSGMVIDLGYLRRAIAPVRDALDHRLLDEVPGLGRPTLEGLCAFIAARLQPDVPGLAWVKVWRDASGDACKLTLSAAPPGSPSPA